MAAFWHRPRLPERGGRAERWEGHGQMHGFVSLDRLLAAEAPHREAWERLRSAGPALSDAWQEPSVAVRMDEFRVALRALEGKEWEKA